MVAREVTVTIREKNQMTVPESFIRMLGLRAGDKLVLCLDGEGWAFRARVLPRSYAGIAPGIYGEPEEEAAYVVGERDAWDTTLQNTD